MPEIVESWRALAEVDDAGAQRAMIARFHDLALQAEAERVPRLRTMIGEEYDLDPTLLHRFTANRLRSWLRLPPEEATAIAEGYNIVFDGMPSGVAMRRAGAVQTVARAMSADEVTRLQGIIPSLMLQIPAGQVAAHATQPPGSGAPDEKKRGWKFWKN